MKSHDKDNYPKRSEEVSVKLRDLLQRTDIPDMSRFDNNMIWRKEEEYAETMEQDNTQGTDTSDSAE